MYYFPVSFHSLGGRIALRISSLFGLASSGASWFFLAPMGKTENGNDQYSKMWKVKKLRRFQIKEIIPTKTSLEWV